MVFADQGLVRRLAGDRRVRYLLAGGLAAAVYYATFTAGWTVSRHSWPYLAVAVLANFVTTVVTYPVYRSLVFRVDGPWLAGFFRFYILCIGALLINVVCLPALVEIAGWNVLIA